MRWSGGERDGNIGENQISDYPSHPRSGKGREEGLKSPSVYLPSH